MRHRGLPFAGMRAGALLLAAAAATPVVAAGCKIIVMATLPVVMEGTRPTVAAQINGVDATFMVDSGAFFGFITPGSAAQFGLRLTPAPFGLTVHGIGGSSSVQVATVKKFGVAGQILPNVQFLVGGSEVGGDRGGVIGENLLGIGDTEYDLAKGVVRLIRTESCSPANYPYWAKTEPFSEIDIKPDRQGVSKKIMASATVNGTRLRVQFDTGASTSIMTRSAAKRAGIDVDGPSVTAGGYSTGLGKRAVRTWIVPVDVFKIGGEEVRKTKLRVIDSIADTAEAPDMLIGADFFLSHHIYVAKGLRKLYFTYNGGNVFNLKIIPSDLPATAADTAPVAASAMATASSGAPALPGVAPSASAAAAPVNADEPTTAEAIARRGAAYAARRDYGRAIADFSKAIALAPAEPRYVLERAQAYMANSQPFLAMADLDQTLKLRPADVSALTMRAGARLLGHDKPGARADLDAAAVAAAPEADVRFGMAQLYERADALPQAIGQFDLWIKAHRDDAKQAQALNGRCWSRALLGEQLDLALKDCNAAHRLNDRNVNFLNSRGLVWLRQGEYAKAIADYNAVIAQNPRIAWSHYGRGIARLRQGAASEGNADIAAALALAPELGTFAKAHGVAP